MQAIVSAEEITQAEWFKHWAGHWSLLSCSYFGEQYTKTIGGKLGVKLEHAVFVHHKGYGVAFLRLDEMQEFGEELARQVLQHEERALEWCDGLKKQTDDILGVISKLEGRVLSWREYSEFVEALYEYINPHIAVKKVVDYLPPEVLQKLLPSFQEARVYSERVYAETEEFMVQLAQLIAGKEGVGRELVLCTLKQEFEEYLKKGVLPPETVLRERFEHSALVFENGVAGLMPSSQVPAIEAALLKTAEAPGVVRGRTAFPGRARGVVKIVFDPAKEGGKFSQGDVLVTGMTRPEYLPLMQKASAVVTDAGGVLCHAAITAREMKIVCVIGTGRATKVFKDGDFVEVDATNAIVKKKTRI